MSRLGYIVRRAAITVILILFVATALFFLFRLLPGDYTTNLMQSGVSAEQAEALKEKWGLNDPLYVQYWRFMTNLFTGNAGTSHATQQPVWETVRPALVNSVILVAPAILVSYLIGSLYGALLGIKRGSIFEKYGIIPPTIAGSTPDFFVGLLFIFVFAATLDLVPAQGLVSVETLNQMDNPSNLDIFMTRDFWYHYILPFATIVVKFTYYPSLIMRSSVVETAGQGFAYFERISGLSSRTRFRHVLRHASLPVITVFPVSMARSLSGLVLIEVVFNWPGIGKLLVTAVSTRDTPVLQFMFLLIGIWIIAGNFLVDIFYSVIDPRITIGEGE